MLNAEQYRSLAPTLDLTHHVKHDAVRIGVLSDTRVNSKWMRPDIIKSLYTKFDAEHVAYVFHCGDITDGHLRYNGHVDDIIHQSYPAMLDHLFDPEQPEGYPRIDAKTYFLGGNYDRTYLRRKGPFGLPTHIGNDINARRSDLIFAGWNVATIKIAPKTTVMLSHPLPGIGSKKPYTISYPLQRRVQALGAGQKPDILLSGYFQKRYEFLPRGVHVHMVSSCIGQTPNELQRDIPAPALGGLILDAHFKTDGSLDFIETTELPFYD